MDLQNGYTVIVDGKRSTIQSSWGAGAHKIFRLADGREIMDLDKAVAAGNVQYMASGTSIPGSGTKPVSQFMLKK